MQVNKIQQTIPFSGEKVSNNKNKFNKNSLIPITGYTSLGFGVAAAFTGSTKDKKIHGACAGLSLASALAHVGILKSAGKKQS